MEPRSSLGPVLTQDVADPVDTDPYPAGFHDALTQDGPDVLIRDARWRSYAPTPEKTVRRALAACAQYGLEPGSVVLASDREVRRLNGRHRGKHKPTNVLTFEPPPGYGGGDIILALETVVREARKAGRPVSHHLAHLVVHGSLHLAGYDHHHPGEAREMEMLESRLLSRMKVPNPWKTRS
ncbi:rRNA maturation RNase YbeY [Acetobacter sp.]|jgi:probable rRNA maturation factor|uniref:rRNA maturation RNase YbeY n=1 Tax=Acetobacter sp. TaxID=440 RepID=UPI0039E77AC8